MKKVFIFKEDKKTRRTYGGYNVTATIFEVKNNVPHEIGETKWQTASFKGERSEILDFLIKNKKVSPKCSREGYYSDEKANKCGVEIRGI